jgi:IPT/TIG domain
LIKLWPYPTPSGQAKTESSASQPGSGTPPSGNEPKAAATPTPTPKLPDPETIYFLQGRFQAQVYLETRLLLLVMLSGALGSLMHSLRSLYWYTGNRMMVWSWMAFYLLLPVTGAILAIIFYFVVRGGFFSSTASFETTSPFGFAALSALVGLFSPQATLKLKEIAETIFAKPGDGTDSKPQETSSQAPNPAPTITKLDPTSGKAGDSVVITGTGFSEGVVVKFRGVTAVVSVSSDTSITAVVPENPSASAPVDVQVTNSDGQSVTSSQQFTFVAGGEGGTTDEGTTDELDGHDEIKSNTTDEELPITEGGVG